jgi:3-deoxy-D-manno-octulosonic-acid transferase
VSPALALYRLITRLIEPLAPRLLDRRAAQGKEDPARVDERLGVAGVERPDGEVVWLHGVSVGETLSLLPLVERFRRARPDLTVLVTSGTVTSAELMARRLPPGVIHQYAPVDGPCAVAAFLDYWRPSLGVLVESELWPNLLVEARTRGVRLALVSARITEKTADGWKRAPGMARRLISGFDLILPQDQASADRLSAMGGRIDGQVNLKLAGDPLPHDGAAFSRLSAAIGDTPVIVAASTHEGEELALTRALDVLPTRGLLILVPRHPERGPAVAAALSQAGYRAGLRSQGDVLTETSGAYVADTLGELGLFLRLADVVIMGGSFAPALGLDPVGGHNPLEPARLGKATISGPDVSNWQAVAALLHDAGGLTIVQAPSDLPAVIAPLLADPDAAAAMGERARRAAADAGSGLDRLWGDLQPLLPEKPAGARR